MVLGGIFDAVLQLAVPLWQLFGYLISATRKRKLGRPFGSIFHHLVDAYNLANTTPNRLYDIVLGGVLSATFIPVFVDRLSTRSPAEAWRAISAVTLPSLPPASRIRAATP